MVVTKILKNYTAGGLRESFETVFANQSIRISVGSISVTHSLIF